MEETCDVFVLGGGPAGSTAAALLAEKGWKTVIVDKERHPRFHIGESLIPETYWVLQRLKMLDKMKKSHFIKKYSVQFVNANGKLSAPFYFHDNKPHECSQTWQVVRSEFDHMMLTNAREHGVAAFEGVRVRDVLFDGPRAVGVRIQEEGGALREIRARVVVDASGQTGLLMNKLELRVWDPLLDKGAITKSEFDRQNTQCLGALEQVSAAQARTEMMAKSVTDGLVRAPFEGVVSEKFVTPGEWVAPGKPLFTLVDDDPAYDLGGTLTESLRKRITLQHHRCYSCFAYGSSCSEIDR